MGQDRGSAADKSAIDLFNNLRDETSQILQRLSALDQKTADMKEDVSSLCQLVRDGNGQPSIAHRLTAVEQQIQPIQSQLQEVATNCSSIAAARTLSKSQVLAGLVVMIVTAVLSLIALVL